jgi:hypothetical protein
MGQDAEGAAAKAYEVVPDGCRLVRVDGAADYSISVWAWKGSQWNAIERDCGRFDVYRLTPEKCFCEAGNFGTEADAIDALRAIYGPVVVPLDIMETGRGGVVGEDAAPVKAPKKRTRKTHPCQCGTGCGRVASSGHRLSTTCRRTEEMMAAVDEACHYTASAYVEDITMLQAKVIEERQRAQMATERGNITARELDAARADIARHLEVNASLAADLARADDRHTGTMATLTAANDTIDLLRLEAERRESVINERDETVEGLESEVIVWRHELSKSRDALEVMTLDLAERLREIATLRGRFAAACVAAVVLAVVAVVGGVML